MTIFIHKRNYFNKNKKMICQTSQLPGLCEEGSCSSIDVSVGQSFSRAPPQSHRLSTRYTTCLCSWKRTQTDVLVRPCRGRRHAASRSGYKEAKTRQCVFSPQTPGRTAAEPSAWKMFVVYEPPPHLFHPEYQMQGLQCWEVWQRATISRQTLINY